MKLNSAFSIRTKIVAGTATIMVLAMVFVATYYPSKQEKQILEAFQSRVTGIAEMVALSTGIAFGMEEYSAIVETFEWAKSDSLVAYIIMADEYHEIFAVYNPDSLSVQDIVSTSIDPVVLQDEFLKCSAPIIFRSIDRGTLYLGYSLRRVQQQISHNSRIAVLITSSIFGLGLILAFIFSHFITKRLKGLQAVAENVSNGNFNISFDKYGTDELGVLAEAFKTMISSVNANIQLVQESEKRVLDITATLGEALCVIDVKGIITFSNPEATNLMGWSSSELIGNDLHSLFHDHTSIHSDVDQHDCFLSISNLRDKNQHQHDHNFIDKSGVVVPVSYNMNQLIQEGESTGWVITFHEITERKRRIKNLNDTKEEFRQLSEQLAESDSLKELLLDIITHDLKNPAGNIMVVSDMLMSEYPQDDMIELINKTSTRLIKVMDDAVTLYQASFGEDIVKEPIQLSDLISQIIEDSKSMLSSTQMQVESAIDSDVIINAHPLISEVFKNYISNAIKYAPEGKKILLECTVEPKAFLVTCKDYGTPIPEKYRSRIFTRRAQLANGERRGRGLGLAIVKRIAEAHGGEVWVEPNRPVGNCFCLRLPR